MGVPTVVVRRAAHGQGAGPTMEAGPNELHMATDGVAGCGVAVIQVRQFGFPAPDGTATTSQIWMRKQIGSEILTFAGVKKGDDVQI
ncbi:hypothetical protein OROMI_003708 [Orobanche minor]